jgi:hypothetical protein
MVRHIPYKADEIKEPSLRFLNSDSTNPQDIVRYKPYQPQPISGKIGLIFHKNIEEHVNTMLEWLRGQNNTWPFREGINSTFGTRFQFISENYEQFDLSDIFSKMNEFDVSVIFLPPEHSGNDSIYNEIKAKAVFMKKRVQVINHGEFLNKFIKERNNAAKGVFILNFGVQLYTKTGGIPWIIMDKYNYPEKFSINNSLIVGISFIKVKSEEQEYISYGVSQIMNLYGLTLKFNIFPAKYDPLRGYFLPEEVMKELISNLIEQYDIENLYIYKTSPFHTEEKSGIESAVSDDLTYFATHVKLSGFSVRCYDPRQENYCNRRGICLINQEKMKVILWTTGNAELRGRLKKHVLGTPKSIELNVKTNRNEDNKEEREDMLKHISFQTLALTKLDWEHAMWNVRTPVILKYARRAGKLCRYIYDSSMVSDDLKRIVERFDVRDVM